MRHNDCAQQLNGKRTRSARGRAERLGSRCAAKETPATVDCNCDWTSRQRERPRRWTFRRRPDGFVRIDAWRTDEEKRYTESVQRLMRYQTFIFHADDCITIKYYYDVVGFPPATGTGRPRGTKRYHALYCYNKRSTHKRCCARVLRRFVGNRERHRYRSVSPHAMETTTTSAAEREFGLSCRPQWCSNKPGAPWPHTPVFINCDIFLYNFHVSYCIVLCIRITNASPSHSSCRYIHMNYLCLSTTTSFSDFLGKK